MKINTICALVAGGASGLGEATVRRLVAGGACCVILDPNRLRGEALAQEFAGSVIFVAGSVTETDDVKKAISAASSRPLRLAVITAVAGTLEPLIYASGQAGDLDDFRQVIDVGLIGAFNVMRLVAEHMSSLPRLDDGQRGVIINTSSISALDGGAPHIAYTAAKSAVAAMSLSGARDLAPHGIRLMCIAPGGFRTPLVTGMPEAVLDQIAKLALFPVRMGDPDEYARLAIHIFENAYLNGDTIRLDAGSRSVFLHTANS